MEVPQVCSPSTQQEGRPRTRANGRPVATVALMRSQWRPTLIVSGCLAAAVLVGVSVAGGQVQGTSGIGTAPAGTTVSPAPSTPANTSAYPQARAADQTRPLVLPRRGRRPTRFALYFTLRERPGHAGVLGTDYRISVSAPPHTRAICRPPVLPNITSGDTGEVVRVMLSTPSVGWCAGRYKATILLQRGPYCPMPAPGRPPTPCPEFASQDLDAGHAYFVVQST
jgi:hypothetical protein